MGPIFLADVHLSADSPGVRRRFADFLERLPAGSLLWILGDLVDAWVEGPDFDLSDDVPELRLLRRHRVHLVPGNRDFLAGPRFVEATGADVHGDVATTGVDGIRTVVTHGDLLCRHDLRYRFWRTLARTKTFRRAAGRAGEARARAWAARFRRASAWETSRKDVRTTAADPETALALLRHYDSWNLIAGHVHRPGIHTYPDGRQMVLLGDWSADGEVAVRRDNRWLLLKPEALPVS